jgi:hypothetical protein
MSEKRVTPSSYFAPSGRRQRGEKRERISLWVDESMVAGLAHVADDEGGLSFSDTLRLVIKRGLQASGAPAPRKEAEEWRKP